MRSAKATLLSALPFALFLSACGAGAPPPQKPPEVGVIIVASRPVTLTSELPGRISAFETSEVRPQISGVIRRRLFTEGAEVRQGQLLYEIEDAPYRAMAANAEGQLGRAEAMIESTRLQADRYRELVALNAVSRQDADNAFAAARQARADVAAQRGTLESARVNLGFTRIRAPISGQIGRSLFTPGALVQTGQAAPLATIQRLDPVYVDVTQSAADLLSLRAAIADGRIGADKGGALAVTLQLPNGATYPIQGRLQFTDVTVDATTGAVTLRAVFANPGRMLLPGMTVRAKVAQGIDAQGILVPQQSINRDELGRGVALIVNARNVVEQRIVTTDRAVANDWLVTDGLKPGDRVIVDGLFNAKPGDTVTPRPPERTAQSPARAGGR